MQINPSKTLKASGSILFVTLILAVLLGFTLGSYLYWVRTQNLLVAESQTWNSALAIAEAGIEEGMAQINVNVGRLNPLDYSASIATNWGPPSGSVYIRTNPLGYSTIVSNDSPPTIYSSGTTSVPLVGKGVTRTVVVKTATNALFGVAIAALQNITMNGGNIYVDAYDSSDWVHFPSGLYNYTNAMAKGDVATMTGILSVGNADIHGRIILAPGAGYTIGPNGLVGDMPWNWPAQSQVETPTNDWVLTDFNKDFSDVLAPYATGLTLPGGTGTNQYVLTGGNYYAGSGLQINNNKTLLAASGVNILYVTGGDFNAKPGSTIAIAPGAFLKVYVGAATGAAVSASFDQLNNGGNANNFQFYGLPTCTTFNLNGNGAYIGTVYAPETQLKFNGGGNNTLDFQGACVVGSAVLDGHFHIHYDVNLGRSGPVGGYTLASWREL